MAEEVQGRGGCLPALSAEAKSFPEVLGELQWICQFSTDLSLLFPDALCYLECNKGMCLEDKLFNFPVSSDTSFPGTCTQSASAINTLVVWIRMC